MHRLLLTGLSVFGVAAAVAGATHTEHAESVVSFEFARGDATWKGRVIALASPCERRRRVAVKKLQPGPDVVVAEVRTDARGRYWAHGEVEYATYYAKVQPEERRDGGIRCQRNRSATITIAQAEPSNLIVPRGVPQRDLACLARAEFRGCTRP